MVREQARAPDHLEERRAALEEPVLTGPEDALSSDEYGLTATEALRGESLGSRLAREEPDQEALALAEESFPGAGITHPHAPPVLDWNVVATVREHHWHAALGILGRFGEVRPAGFRNVAVMRVADPAAFLTELATALEADPGILDAIAHVVPLEHVFDFDTPEEFEDRARDLALTWVPDLAGCSFHVRFHRRGHAHELPRPDEESFLGEALLLALAEAGTPGRVSFDDPDAVIHVETVGSRAGLALWTRDDRRDYPLLAVD